MSRVKAVEQKLKIESSEQTNERLTKEELQASAELFLYLSSWPNLWFRFWSSFYTDFFQTQPADQIILTLNRMTKINSPHNRDGKLRAEKLLQRAADLLSLRFEEIQSLLPGKEVAYRSTIKNKNFDISKGTHFNR